VPPPAGYFERPRPSALATAIAAATSADTINVYGTCYGNFGKDLTLQRRGKRATLDGNKTGRVLRINAGTTTLPDLTITNGETTSLGGGIFVRPSTAAVLVNVLVTGNAAGAKSFGGGIEADENSTLTLISSTVSGNTAGGSGGIDIWAFPCRYAGTTSALATRERHSPPSAPFA